MNVMESLHFFLFEFYKGQIIQQQKYFLINI